MRERQRIVGYCYLPVHMHINNELVSVVVIFYYGPIAIMALLIERKAHNAGNSDEY